MDSEFRSFHKDLPFRIVQRPPAAGGHFTGRLNYLSASGPQDLRYFFFRYFRSWRRALRSCARRRARREAAWSGQSIDMIGTGAATAPVEFPAFQSTVRVKVTLPVSGLAAESVAVAVRTYDPLAAAIGVPEIAPLVASSVIPAGSEPVTAYR